MPLYEFECANCGEVIEMLLSSSELEDFDESCPNCSGKLHRIFSSSTCNIKEKEGGKPPCFSGG